jgi:hypothetical protein
MSLSRQRALSAICTLSIVAFCGCGGPPEKQIAEAKGVLTFEGNPVANYSIYFVSTAGDLATGVSDAEGRFTLKTGNRTGAPVGDCKVYIQEPVDMVEFTPEQTADLTTEEIYKMQHSNRTKPRDPEKKKLGIPAKYNSAEKSGLKFTVVADASKNVFEVKLTK